MSIVFWIFLYILSSPSPMASTPRENHWRNICILCGYSFVKINFWIEKMSDFFTKLTSSWLKNPPILHWEWEVLIHSGPPGPTTYAGLLIWSDGIVLYQRNRSDLWRSILSLHSPVHDHMCDWCSPDWAIAAECIPNVGMKILRVAHIRSIVTFIYWHINSGIFGMRLKKKKTIVISCFDEKILEVKAITKEYFSAVSTQSSQGILFFRE